MIVGIEGGVVVDTSFLITLYNRKRANHATAYRYFKEFLKRELPIYLSTIVVSEYQQKGTVMDMINSGHYLMNDFTYEDALKAAEIAHNLGVLRDNEIEDEQARLGDKEAEIIPGNRANTKDDIKIIAQAEVQKAEFIIMDDERTMEKNVLKLSGASMLSVKPIILSTGYDESVFNGGQTTFKLPE